MVDEGADDFDLVGGEWIAAHGHARSVGETEETFDEEAIGAVAGDDGGTGTAAAEEVGGRGELEFAHGGVAKMAGRAGLLEDGEDVAVEGGFGLAGRGEVGEEKETSGEPEGAG